MVVCKKKLAMLRCKARRGLKRRELSGEEES